MKLIYKRLILINLLFNNFIKKPVHIKHILSHRGYSTIKDDENTIKSVKEAIHKKFKGVEIDIFYDKSMRDFLISHDQYDDPSNLLSLEKILELDYPEYFIFWLDLKNLSIKNVFSCREKIIEYTKKYDKSYIFVESQSYVGLLFLSIQSSIKTSYWISHWIQLLLPTPFTFTSLDYRRYSKNSLFYNTLSKNPINLFTINNKKS